MALVLITVLVTSITGIIAVGVLWRSGGTGAVRRQLRSLVMLAVGTIIVAAVAAAAVLSGTPFVPLLVIIVALANLVILIRRTRYGAVRWTPLLVASAMVLAGFVVVVALLISAVVHN